MTQKEQLIFNKGTLFQQKVWTELLNIPKGQTRTYEDVARAIGNPKAVRAVGTAIGKNNLAVIVPCHRVIKKDGSLGGYRWGIDRKKKLLEREGVVFDNNNKSM